MNRHRINSVNASSEEIASIVARYRGSGLGLKAFAEEEGLPPGRLHYWIYEKSVRGRGRGPTQPPPAAAAALFQEVKLPCRPQWDCGWAAEVGLPGGMAAPWIGSVVQALQTPC